jgi:hypothetical protein
MARPHDGILSGDWVRASATHGDLLAVEANNRIHNDDLDGD